MKIAFSGHTEGVREGLQWLLSDLSAEWTRDGFPVSVTMNSELNCTLHIFKREGSAGIEAKDKPAFFRALGLLIPRLEESTFDYSENRCFERNGIMLDCSRNAVVNLSHMRYLLRKMALMGHSWAMLYTEDVYELESEPYFGYARGRYSQQELKEIDDYADTLGIEVVPCIQTLAHLDRFLHWQAGLAYKDTANTLMVGNPDVYDFIERMIVSASTPFRSRRIHIGMDEAWNLGRGKLLDQKGYHTPAELMAEHLAKVHEIISRHGLHAMMWSDMHFENAGPGGYYGDNKKFTEEILNSAPKDIDLVFWDYYHEKEDSYDRMLSSHELFEAEKVFAGGIWTWSGIAPDYRKTVKVAIPGLTQCMRHGIKEVFATAWGDNGGECPATATLLGLQIYAEYDYAHTSDMAQISRRFQECVGMRAEDLLPLGELHYPCELPKDETSVINACKVLLYEDPLIPLFEADFPGKLHEHYEQLQRQIEDSAQRSAAEFKPMMHFYETLCRALRYKCLWREQAAAAVRGGSREAAKALCDLAIENMEILKQLNCCWRTLWMYTNKPYGFEVVDGRVGWLQARFHTAMIRMDDFAQGRIDDIPELSDAKLPYLMAKGKYINSFNWAPMVSPGLV